MRKLRSAKGGIYRYSNGSKPCAAQVNLQKFWTISANDRDTIATGDTGLRKTLGPLTGNGEGFVIGPLDITAFEKNTLPVSIRLALEYSRQNPILRWKLLDYPGIAVSLGNHACHLRSLVHLSTRRVLTRNVSPTSVHPDMPR